MCTASSSSIDERTKRDDDDELNHDVQNLVDESGNILHREKVKTLIKQELTKYKNKKLTDKTDYRILSGLLAKKFKSNEEMMTKREKIQE